MVAMGIEFDKGLFALMNFMYFCPYDRRPWDGEEVDCMGQPVLFTGPPGTAKTAKIGQFIAYWGGAMHSLPPGEVGEGAFGVTGVPEGKGANMRLVFPPPQDVDKFSAMEVGGGRGLVFIDEFRDASRIQLPAIQALVHARRWGGYQLPPWVRVWGSSNDQNVSGNGRKITIPLANRMYHVPWPIPTAAERAEHRRVMWSRTGKVKLPEPHDAEAEEKRVLALWPAKIDAAVASVEMFLQRFKTEKVLHNMPEWKSDAAVGPWPSHRTWDLVENAIAGGPIFGLSQDQVQTLASQAIGSKEAGKYFTFLRNLDIPDALPWLDGQAAFKHDPAKLDRTYVLLHQAAAVLQDPDTADKPRRIEALFGHMKELKNTELVTYPATRLSSNPLTVGLCSGPNALALLTSIRMTLERAGLNHMERR